MSLGVYAGTFDPPTNGHGWVFDTASRLFDRLLVLVTVNPDKKTAFSLEERMLLVREMLPPNASVEALSGVFTATYARRAGATALIRGIRSVGDYEFERVLADVNETVAPGLPTVFLLPPTHLGGVSSTLVRGLVGPEGWEALVARYVPPHVLDRLRAKKGI